MKFIQSDSVPYSLSGSKSGANLGISIHLALAEVAPVLRSQGTTSLPNESKTKLFVQGCPLYKRAGGI